MAYQNVGKPRFFIDNYQYLRALGLNPTDYIGGDIPDNWEGSLTKDNDADKTPIDNPSAFILDPTQSKTFVNTANEGLGWGQMRFHIPCGQYVKDFDFSGNMKWYTAVLNHNIHDSGTDAGGEVGARFQNIMFMDRIGGGSETFSEDNFFGSMTSILNTHASRYNQENGTSIWFTNLSPSDILTEEGEDWIPRYAGFQITTEGENISRLGSFSCGAISSGVMYTMPYSADLDLSIDYVSDGYDTRQTKGGRTFTNIVHSGASSWTHNGKFINPFAVGEYSDSNYLDGAKRVGRKEWTLRFSYIADKDLFSSNYMMNNYMETTDNYDADDKDSEGKFEYNIFTDDSFVAQVWNKTLGGALPFIFQPDSTNDNPDQFCLARLVNDTLEIQQEAYNTYSISVVIQEIW